MCLPTGGVFLPSGVFDSDGGGGDAHQAGSRQGRAGEVSTVQGCLQRSQERKGRIYFKRLNVSLSRLFKCYISDFTFFFSSFAFHVEPKSFPSSPGPTSASSAKGKLRQCYLK